MNFPQRLCRTRPNGGPLDCHNSYSRKASIGSPQPVTEMSRQTEPVTQGPSLLTCAVYSRQLSEVQETCRSSDLHSRL